MKQLRAWMFRLSGMFRTERQEQELADEMESHLQFHIEDNLRRGMTPEQARRDAILKLGGVEQTKQAYRERSTIPFIENLLQDVRYALRQMHKSPGFAITAIVTLALGIGINTTIFSLMNGMFLRPFPVKNPGQLIQLGFQQKDAPLQPTFSIPEYRDLQNQTASVFSRLSASENGLDGLSVNRKAARIVTNYVAGNYFSMLGVKPALGRFFLPSEGKTPGADPVLVLSYAYWKQHLGGDPEIVGQKVSVDGHPFTIIGITPKNFRGLGALLSVQGYLPLGMATIEGYSPSLMEIRTNRSLFIYGRLQLGKSLKDAQPLLNVIASRWAQEHPDSEKDVNVQVFPQSSGRMGGLDPNNTSRMIVVLFLGLAGMVLLLACVNIANLLLVRATVREREMAMRLALGAMRSRLLWQLLTESIVLSLIGGIAGVALGWLGNRALSSMSFNSSLPMHLDLGFDWQVFAYSFGTALFAGVLVGIIPAVRVSRQNLSSILHEGGRGVAGNRNRTRNALVVAQVGVSLMLLIIAGLFTRSLTKVQRTDLGFDPSHVLNLSMDPNEIGYTDAQTRDFYKSLVDRVRALPGVVSATTAGSVAMSYIADPDQTITVEGHQKPSDQAAPTANLNIISPEYFRTMRIPIIHGRAFTDGDTEKGLYVAIINQAMAQQFWPNQNPIGKQFKMHDDSKHFLQVVGVATNARYNAVFAPVSPYFYVPFMQHSTLDSLQTLQVRTATSPEEMVPAIERTVQTLAPEMPLFDVRTMHQSLYTFNGFQLYQVAAGLASVLGFLGLILAVVGIYGVMSYTVSQKTLEIGIRIALGAQRSDILRMVFQQGLLIIGIGLVIGITAAFAVSRLLKAFLVVSAVDPATYLTVSATLTIIALIACYIPARRAMHIDPMQALRTE